jgi:mono/diheme cytochrome c family protein
LSLKTYADALKGGEDGPAIVTNDPDKSLLVQIQQKGGHPGQFTPEELDRVIAWIKAGAPETGSGAPIAPTPSTPAAVTWSDFQAAFSMKCGTCHVQTQLGGLSLKTYADVLKGGKNGPAIVPSDPDKSVLVQVMQKGDHPNLLSPQELDALLAWIKAGAPETASSAATPSPNSSAAAEGWTEGIEQIFGAKCAACHIQAQSGGLSLKTYADALKGGQGGPVIVPNDPDKSVLVQIQQKGGHPGQLSTDELARIIAWIKAGAPETAGSAATPTASSTSSTLWSDIDKILTAKCAACHINTATAGISFKSYADAVKSAIKPGDPDQSLLVQVQQKGGHPGQLTPDELATIIAWIKAGAPEK